MGSILGLLGIGGGGGSIGVSASANSSATSGPAVSGGQGLVKFGTISLGGSKTIWIVLLAAAAGLVFFVKPGK